jgi:hypothetical protein
VRLGASTEIQVGAVQTGPGGSVTTVRQGSGSLKVQVPKGGGSQFQVRTPSAVLAVRGTVFNSIVQAVEGTQVYRTILEVEEGTVEYQALDRSGEPIGEPQACQEGYRVEILTDTVPAAPQADPRLLEKASFSGSPGVETSTSQGEPTEAGFGEPISPEGPQGSSSSSSPSSPCMPCSP